jgi:hypothetical protein
VFSPDYNYVAPQGSQALTPLVFSFVKECLQFTIVTGLDIGSQSGTSDIAAAGEPTIHWQTIQPWTYHANQIPNFQFDQYFCLGCGAVFPVPADSITFQITYDILEEGILAINWLSQSNGGAGVVQSGKENELTMSATVQCLQPGTAQVNWEAFLGPTNEIIAYGFTYPCIFPLLDVVYGSATGTPVATQTVPTAQWNGQNEAAVIAGDETTSVFFFYLDQANNPAELANQQYQLSFIVDPAVMGDPTVDDRQMYNAAYLENSQGTSITWDCIAPGDTTVTMIVNYGWAQPMKIAFTKQCPEAHHSSGGWSAAGVFFFVVFLLGLAFCLGGCGT